MIDEGGGDNIVKEIVNEIVETVVQQENEAVESGLHVDECPSDEISCTAPCSQMLRRDLYARQRLIFFNT